MCTVSDKLKLCTCGVSLENIDSLENYWIFYKYGKEPDQFIIGEPMFPYELTTNDYKSNVHQLTKLLNDGNPFDVIITPTENDILQISLQRKHHEQDEKHLHYGFEYLHGKWVLDAYFTPLFLNEYEALQAGEVKNALEGK
jgi:hypothetical protein